MKSFVFVLNSTLRSSKCATAYYVVLVTILPLIRHFFHSSSLVHGHLITPAAYLRAIPTGSLEAVPDHWLGKRGHQDCDGVGTFRCPIGTCYTGYNGFIGCCSVSSCRARTACYESELISIASCNPDTEGCVNCDDSDYPFCVTETNVLEKQYIIYCGTTRTTIVHSYRNLVTTGSIDPSPTPTSEDVSEEAESTTEDTIPSATDEISSSDDDTDTDNEDEQIEDEQNEDEQIEDDAQNEDEQSEDGDGGEEEVEESEDGQNVGDEENVDEDDGSDSNAISGGMIAGIAIGSATGSALVFFLLFWFFFRQKTESRSSWISEKWFKKDLQNAAAGATPLFSWNDQSPANTPRGLGLNDFEGSVPETKQHPWAPSSLAKYTGSPELEGSQGMNAELDDVSVANGPRPNGGSTVGTASISHYGAGSPSFRGSCNISREATSPPTRIQSQELLSLSSPQELSGISAVEGTSTKALETKKNDTDQSQLKDQNQQNGDFTINTENSKTGDVIAHSATLSKTSEHPFESEKGIEKARDNRYISAEMAITGGYWENADKEINGGEVRNQHVEGSKSGAAMDAGQSEL